MYISTAIHMYDSYVNFAEGGQREIAVFWWGKKIKKAAAIGLLGDGSLCHSRHTLKILERSVHNFLSYLANTQTNRQTNKQSLAKTLPPRRR